MENNIHVLPTDKPSRLVKNINSELKLTIQMLPKDDEIGCYPQNIYITNDEEIKEGDYVCASGGFRFVKTLNNDRARTFKDDGIVSKQNPSSSCHLSNYKKIILTTDDQLIKDGVQSIDDEFLEWFVKNPSCESVEVRKEKYSERFDNDKSAIGNANTWGNRWVIIIPKEEPTIVRLPTYYEPKQESFVERMKPLQEQWQQDMDKELSKQETTLEEVAIHNTMTYVIHKDKKKIVEVLEWIEINGKMHPKNKKTTYFKSEDKPKQGTMSEAIKQVVTDKLKQETLEEVLLKKADVDNRIDLNAYANGLNDGAKWQQEKMLAFINDEDNHTEGELGNS
jgi:hypothetical protein